MDDAYLEAISDAEPYPYWYDDVDEPESNRTLVRTESCDLCVVGGGYTGLWTAIIAKERDPSRDVVLVEGDTVGWGASGRNGGFMEASLTHGVANGQL
ncbi:MAG TPA: FAD-dependent oxidoreductase, partial [Acidimicrobiales bacterium]